MDANKYFEKSLGPTTIGSLIRAYRTQNDFSQSVLAKKLKLKVSYISDLENGRKKLSLEKALEIAKKLGEFVELYAKVWTEESFRDAGLDFEKVVHFKPKKRPSKKSSSLSQGSYSIDLPNPYKSVYASKKSTTRKSPSFMGKGKRS